MHLCAFFPGSRLWPTTTIQRASKLCFGLVVLKYVSINVDLCAQLSLYFHTRKHIRAFILHQPAQCILERDLEIERRPSRRMKDSCLAKRHGGLDDGVVEIPWVVVVVVFRVHVHVHVRVRRALETDSKTLETTVQRQTCRCCLPDLVRPERNWHRLHPRQKKTGPSFDPKSREWTALAWLT